MQATRRKTEISEYAAHPCPWLTHQLWAFALSHVFNSACAGYQNDHLLCNWTLVEVWRKKKKKPEQNQLLFLLIPSPWGSDILSRHRCWEEGQWKCLVWQDLTNTVEIPTVWEIKLYAWLNGRKIKYEKNKYTSSLLLFFRSMFNLENYCSNALPTSFHSLVLTC